MTIIGNDLEIRLSNDALTEKVVDGAGIFDVLMRSVSVHLRAEYDASRITGAEYSKTYAALVEATLANSVQFLLGRDKTYWEAKASRYQVETLLPAQLAQITTETARASVEKDKATYELTYILPEQKKIVSEQAEAQRAQTLNTRFDGTTVAGVLGQQKALYTQQITSYQRDAEVKAAKLFTDAWTVQKTIDEGLLAPTNFQNATVDTVLNAIKANNGLATP